ncbi:SDR family NAD(P)-dependent oxidoreductase [Leucobacter luti]|uniref:NADP-dependent 3-hydroxy acid dehydrogenase YdfG n=1 Tax=Leucobacter luti TaxID=340320 RepID=A0A4Q7TZN8_9MICO|nr:SDR family NAD(P)-dependent oxidoreductase [Leucobacter luti]MBL3698585.1 SDR family NAD(P)-dependent oxidoreductase [Leucobacter luti]RZT65960.1 NADP-dependent 3-hydroxy acid dehydrogenase YdfG [Leucobacter luti]
MLKRVVVTGASSGIGAATVRRFTELGWQTVAVARRADRLQQLAAETGAHPVQCDVTDEAQVAALAAEVAATGGAVGLVNNAGGALGTESVEASSNDDWRRMFEVNVLGLRSVTAALLPVLPAGAAATGWASILNLTSTAGHAAYPGGGGYNAAKYAAHAVTEVLRLELAGEPIRVMELAPGLVHTEEFTLNRLRGDAEGAARAYADVTPLLAEDVARVLVGAFEQPPHVNQDLIVLRPVAQSSVFHTHRGPLAPRG